jgi:hypothetical protein
MAKADLRQFDYKEVARLDGSMWRAYYNHQFIRMCWLLIKLMRSQLRVNWLVTLQLAYWAGTAAIIYRVKLGNENYDHVLRNLTKFYKLVSAKITSPFDYEKAAKLELEWWDIHRYPKKYKKSLAQSLADGAAVMYKVKADSLLKYAGYRAQAMQLPNHSGDDQPQPVDWDRIYGLLEKSWAGLHKSVNNSRG